LLPTLGNAKEGATGTPRGEEEVPTRDRHAKKIVGIREEPR